MASHARRLPSWEIALGQAITARRKSLGLTRAQFAEKYKIPIDSLRGWETGEGLPQWESAFAFMRALGNANRERFHIHLGPLIDEIREWSNEEAALRSRAFDALAIVLERTTEAERAKWVKTIEDAAAWYSGIEVKKKRPTSIRNSERKRRKTGTE